MANGTNQQNQPAANNVKTSQIPTVTTPAPNAVKPAEPPAKEKKTKCEPEKMVYDPHSPEYVEAGESKPKSTKASASSSKAKNAELGRPDLEVAQMVDELEIATDLTEDVIKRILRWLVCGSSLTVAARAAGVSGKLLQERIAQDEHLKDRLMQARAVFRARLLGRISQTGEWKAQVTLMEKGFWGKLKPPAEQTGEQESENDRAVRRDLLRLLEEAEKNEAAAEAAPPGEDARTKIRRERASYFQQWPMGTSVLGEPDPVDVRPQTETDEPALLHVPGSEPGADEPARCDDGGV